MVTLWHVLFLACLPAAIVLAFAGQWVGTAGVFFVATPIFWTLRNRAARSEGGDPLARELRGRPTRYAIPSDVRTKLSARSLEDVPGQVRIGSPHDASDADVADALAKLVNGG